MKKSIIKYVHSDILLERADENPAVKQRASMIHQLIATYGLLAHMQLVQPKTCSPANLRLFHSMDYLQQLARCKDSDGSSDEESYSGQNTWQDYGLGFDCPTWRNLQSYVCSIAGATMTACELLRTSLEETQQVIINWTGGWHHAHRDKAGGYCYINDIVLGILVLRKRFQRVLYLDLDVHHGDGVQEAFETTKRVFTLSFHQYECGFYPGTGSATDCGFGGGKGYAANFPYLSGIMGAHFQQYFKSVTQLILLRYQPDVCVIQCGADAIVGDPLGSTNLTPQDLITCVQFVVVQLSTANIPTILLGGGGYNFANTSRYWTLLTAALCGQSLADDIPDTSPHFLQYGPDYCLNIEAKQANDLNTVAYLEKCTRTIEDNLEKYNVMAI